MFEVGIGTSQNWDPVQAASEVIQQALKDLSKPPKFVLLFSSIHYEKEKGFQKILDTVYHFITKDTPLIGGTVAGFMNNHGCFTRGLTALACYSDEIDVATGVGHNTKRNPGKAARDAAKMIRNALTASKYKNKFLFEIVSGGMIPRIGIMRKRIFRKGLLAKIASNLSELSLILFQLGVGREEETLDELTKQLPDFTILGGSAIDDNKMEQNVQFYYNTLLTNSIVGLAVLTNLDFDLITTYGHSKTGKAFEVSKTGASNRIIKKLNGRPALQELLEKIGWPEQYLTERIYRKTFFYPLGYEKNGILYPEVMGLFLGNDVVVGYKIEGKTLHLLSASGKQYISSIETLLDIAQGKQIALNLGVFCAAALETFGRQVYAIRSRILKANKDAKFFVVFAGGEDTYRPHTNDIRHVNESFNTLFLWNK